MYGGFIKLLVLMDVVYGLDQFVDNVDDPF